MVSCKTVVPSKLFHTLFHPISSVLMQTHISIDENSYYYTKSAEHKAIYKGPKFISD